MKRNEQETLLYNNRKQAIDAFFAEPVKVGLVFAFALADCATIFIVFDTYLPQNKYLTYALTILFSLALSLIPVQLAFACRIPVNKKTDSEGNNNAEHMRKRRIIIFLSSLEAFTFSVQMIGRLFTTQAVTGGSKTIDLDVKGAVSGVDSVASASNDALTAADYYGSILLGLLCLVFGGIIFAVHYLSKEDVIIEARTFNKDLEKKIIVNRLRARLAEMGSTDDFLHMQMMRLSEKCRSIISEANIAHISRVTDSQTEIAMKNEMNPADGHNIMVEPYMVDAKGSKMAS